MMTPIEVGRRIGETVDLSAADLSAACLNLARTLQQLLYRDTPVFDASLSQLVAFGDDNLTRFLRFHAFYRDLARTVDTIDAQSCAEAGHDQLAYMLSQLRIGMGYYGFIADSYDVVQPAQLAGAQPP